MEATFSWGWTNQTSLMDSLRSLDPVRHLALSAIALKSKLVNTKSNRRIALRLLTKTLSAPRQQGVNPKSFSCNLSSRKVCAIFVNLLFAILVSVPTSLFADHGTTEDVDSIDGSGPDTYNGALVAITDRADWFSFCGTAGTEVTIETTAGTFDTHLFLYSTPDKPAAGDHRADYTQVAANDDGGVGLLSKIVINLPVTGSYVAAVEAFGSSSTAGSYTLVISGDVASCELVEVAIDIKFCSDPNAFNCKKKGVLPVTIFGTADFDVEDIDISSLQLCTADLVSCTNAPRDSSVADRGDPEFDLGAAMCAVIEVEEDVFEEQDYLTQDGYLDLDAAFEASEVQDMLGTFCSDVKGASSDPLVIIGETLGGTAIFSVPVPNVGTDQLWKANK